MVQTSFNRHRKAIDLTYWKVRVLTWLSVFLLTAGMIRAQFPVQVTPQLIAPYSLQLSDYTVGTVPRITVILTNADLAQPLINVRLRMTIRSQQVLIRTREDVLYPSVSLVAGIPQRLALNDLAAYFNINNLDFTGITRAEYQQTGRLPEGFYEFCFEAVEVNTRATVSRSECAVAALSFPDPPLLNLPANNAEINSSDPLNVFFSWTPRHLSSPNAAFSTEYDFQLVELLDNGISPEAAFSSRPPLYQTTTTATSLIYGPAQPALLEGKRYAWRVRAKNIATNGNVEVFRNNGYSQIYAFTYKEFCITPTNVKALVQPTGEVILTWNPIPKFREYIIEYKNRDAINANLFQRSVIVPQYTILDLVPGATYEYRIGNRCKNGGNIFFSNYYTFTAPVPPPNVNKASGKITWAYRESEETESTATPGALVSTTAIPELVSNVPTDNRPGKIVYPLKGAQVKLYGYYTNFGLTMAQLIGTATTDSTGSYNFDLNYYKAKDAANPYVEISHPSEAFNKVRRNVTLTRTPGGYQLGNDQLTGQSFELQPSVYIPGLNISAINNAVSVEILLKEEAFSRYAFMKSAGLGNGGIVTYNNERYVSLIKLTNNKPFKKLFYNPFNYDQYVVRINYPGRLSAYYNFGTVSMPPDQSGQRQVTLRKRTFRYKLFTGIEGVVSYRNQPRRDVRLEFTINRADILSTDTVTKYTAISDGVGFYGNYDLPPLRTGSKIRIALTDRTLRTAPFLDSAYSNDSGSIRKNILLENKLYSVMGRVMDQDGFPVSNALVTIPGTSEQTRTSPEGFYMVKLYGTDSAKLKFTINNFGTQYISVKPGPSNNQAAAGQVLSARQWRQWIEGTDPVRAYITAEGLSEASADLMGIGTGSLETLYDTYFAASDDLKGVISLNTTTVTLIKGTLNVQVKMGTRSIRAQINLPNDLSQIIEADRRYAINLVPGRVAYEIVPVDGGDIFVPVSGEADITANRTTTVTVYVAAGYKVTGTVKDLTDSTRLLDSATISLTGLELSAETDENGVYTLYVPKEPQLTFRVTRPGYNAKDTAFRVSGNMTLNFKLQPRPEGSPEIITMGGFPVEVESLSMMGPERFMISGSVQVDSNGVFYNDPEENSLTFRNITVKVAQGSTNAVPLGEVEFEEATMTTSAFGFAEVEVTGAPLIMMKGLKDARGETSYEHTAIGGAELGLKLSSIPRIASKLPVFLPDATLLPKDSTIKKMNEERQRMGLNKFNYVYSPPDYPINVLSSSQKFDLEFEDDEGSPDSNYVQANVGYILRFMIKKEENTLDKDGLALNGYIQFPKMIGVKMPDSGRVDIEKFLVDPTYRLAELTFKVSKQKPIKAKLQKFETQITKISLYGLGSPNVGVGFGGTVTLKKSGTKDTLTINSLSIVKSAEGTTLSGDFALDSSGISVKSLVFKTPGNNHIAVSYNFSKKSFLIELSGVLSYDKNRSKTAATTSDGAQSGLMSVFPIEIQTFKLQSSDWSLFMAAKANIKIDLKVVKVSVERFVVGLGAGMSMDAMNAYLVEGTPFGASIGTGGPEDLMDESNASWALGIAGGIEFPLKGIQTSVKGSFLIGNINNKIEVRLNEIAIKMEQPSFKLNAKVKLQLSGTRQGFEAEAEFETVSRTFEATFKFYKLSATPTTPAGYEVGASIKASTGIATGFLYWWAIGGGFDFNTAEQKYKVFLQGDVGPVGTPKEVSYVKDAKLSILFDLQNCGAAPVIEGGGTLFLKGKIWGTVTAKLDFCRTILLITVDGNQEAAPGVNLNVKGVLVVMKRTVGNQAKAAFFLGVNANLTSLGDLIKGNVFFALGIDYDNSHPNAPTEVNSLWSKIPDVMKDNSGSYFNGLYISGSVSIPPKEGSWGVSMAGFDAFKFTYAFNVSGSGLLYYKFNDNLFKISAQITASINTSLTVFGISLYGDGFLKLSLDGGHDNSWYMNGSATLGVQLYNNPSTGCNSATVTWSDCCCSNIPYPCGIKMCKKWGIRYPCGVKWCSTRVCIPVPSFAFKVCKSISASFAFRQGQATKVTLNLF